MSIPSWPGDLPQNFLRPYVADMPDVAETTEMEDGPAFRRRKVLSVWTEVNVSLGLTTTAQVTSLKAFWRQTLNGGTSFFTAPVYTFESNTYQTRTCQWIGRGPRFEYFAIGHATASFTLRIRDL